MFQAFVLAAGLGTRLRPLTEHRPKPLVPVCGVPLLAYSLRLCARHGLSRVVVNAHWLSEQVEAWAGLHEGVNVTVSTEKPEVLGTGGGLRKVMHELDPVFVVLNGDVLHDVDLTALVATVRPGGAAMALRKYPDGDHRYGIVAADSANTVWRITSLASIEPEGDANEDTTSRASTPWTERPSNSSHPTPSPASSAQPTSGSYPNGRSRACAPPVPGSTRATPKPTSTPIWTC